jgi:hypothetical protein
MRAWVYGMFWVTLSGSAAPVLAAEPPDVRVATFNTGLHEVFGFDAVPCVDARGRAQRVAFERWIRDRRGAPFILLLQEVQSDKWRKALEGLARTLGIRWITNKAALEQGLAILTNGEPVEAPRFLRLFRGGPRGVLAARLRFGSRVVTAVTSQTDASGPEDPNPKHQRHLRSLAAFLMSRQGGITPPAVFGGDLATGPDHRFLEEEGRGRAYYIPAEELWGLFERTVRRGWRPLPLAKGVTWDAEKNRFIRRPARPPLLPERLPGMREEGDTAVDHILVTPGWEEFTAGGRAELLFDQPEPVRGCELYESDRRGTALLGQHYAVTALLRFPIPKPAVVPAPAPPQPKIAAPIRPKPPNAKKAGVAQPKKPKEKTKRG